MAQMFAPAPEPKTELGRYRILSTTAGARVSPLCLGAMSLGSAWSYFMGSMNKEKSLVLLDAFVDAGGNFIDTANNYQDEESESYLGEWMTARDNRDQIFLATKFTTQYKAHQFGKGSKVANFTGNSRKAMFVSLEDSLRKLQTTYIDLYYVHYWDWTTSIEEVMDALHILVEQGKILYLGICNTPAWVVAAANTYARDHGKTPFSVYQGMWNVMARDFERDIIPMARQFGMALCPYMVIGGGKFQSPAQLKERQEANEGTRKFFRADLSEKEIYTSKVLGEVAAQHGDATVQQIALAYVMLKARYVFPIVGMRKVEQLEANIKALSIRLTDEQMKHLEDANEFDIGIPMSMFGLEPGEAGGPNPMVVDSVPLSFVKAPKPIGHE